MRAHLHVLRCASNRQQLSHVVGQSVVGHVDGHAYRVHSAMTTHDEQMQVNNRLMLVWIHTIPLHVYQSLKHQVSFDDVFTGRWKEKEKPPGARVCVCATSATHWSQAARNAAS